MRNLKALLCVITLTGLVGCSNGESDEIGNGDICSKCASSEDCNPSLTCRGFYGPNAVANLCATRSTNQCEIGAI